MLLVGQINSYELTTRILRSISVLHIGHSVNVVGHTAQQQKCPHGTKITSHYNKQISLAEPRN
jgi:hypothetical protein